ncbi:amidase [Pararhizobium sp.]|uniref:amidase n=1 Tax=Pararhizobium sp. TaxID=1977563 RepID=UPI0027242B7A|nr:amidase [Pararhizobium sp.]MDO9415519.1 amidase [Pararhizobium sp.]
MIKPSSDPSFCDLASLGAGLRKGIWSSRDLTAFFLGRLDTIGRHWNAVASLDAEGALDTADRADAMLARAEDLGPLHGIPFAIKDIFATRPPLPTSWGATPFADRQFSRDAEVVAKLRAAGAILLGKLAMMELAAMFPFETYDASHTGICHNPFNFQAWTGDSSSGSAAAVGGGLVPFSIATETHGSIIQPAAFCGAVGLRPSMNLVSMDGVMPISASMDRVGPMARTPRDCITILHAIAERPIDTTRNSARPRIGILAPGRVDHDAAVVDNFERALAGLGGYADLVPVALPDMPIAETYRSIILFEASRNFAPLIADGTVDRLCSPFAKGGSYLAEHQPIKAYEAALEQRDELFHKWTEAFGSFDALATSTNPKVAPPIDVEFSAYFGDSDHEPLTMIGAVLGLPAVTIPSGLGDRGLPTGIQLVGMPDDDSRICHIAENLLKRIGRPMQKLPGDSGSRNAAGSSEFRLR